MKDSDIDYSDNPDVSNENWALFEPFSVEKKPITIRLDADVVEYFKSMGKGYQTKINAVLKEYQKL